MSRDTPSVTCPRNADKDCYVSSPFGGLDKRARSRRGPLPRRRSVAAHETPRQCAAAYAFRTSFGTRPRSETVYPFADAHSRTAFRSCFEAAGRDGRVGTVAESALRAAVTYGSSSPRELRRVLPRQIDRIRRSIDPERHALPRAVLDRLLRKVVDQLDQILLRHSPTLQKFGRTDSADGNRERTKQPRSGAGTTPVQFSLATRRRRGSLVCIRPTRWTHGSAAEPQ